MDELKHKAGEKLGALHVAAVTAASNGKSRVEDAFNQTTDAFQRIREAFSDLWNNELIAEGREHIAAWARDAVARIKEGAPPLSPVLLYEELVALFHDRVWRKSLVIFACGVALGGGAGVAIGLRAARRAPAGPTARALLASSDHSVILVDDAVAPCACAGEVLVRVQAFSVCALDRRTLRGRGRGMRSLRGVGGVALGRGFAGVVLDVGAGVTEFELGDEVWGVVGESAGGAAIELLTLRSTRISKRPRSLSADAAAALPWAGAGALAALDRLRLNRDTGKGKRVAVCGAASDEGCVLVQLLAAWGAHVAVVAPRHASSTLRDLGAREYIDMDATNEWNALEVRARALGPWDAALTTPAARIPPAARCNTAAILKATAPRGSHLDMRPTPPLSDRLPTPLYLIFAASFYTYRVLRFAVGLGWHTDWLEGRHAGGEGLRVLAELVDEGDLVPVLDKVYLPQDFESALAHACSEDALGTTVVRFP